MSPPPSLAVMENVKAERNKKARDKTQKKKRLKTKSSASLVPVTASVALINPTVSVPILVRATTSCNTEEKQVEENGKEEAAI